MTDLDLPTRCVRPSGARALLVFAHGAGAGMDHAFMEACSAELASHDIASLRYAFPYMAAGRKRPDRQPVLLETVRRALQRARSEHPDLPLFAGGKSMGGRMTSLLAAQDPCADVRGLVFFGFPLHPAGRPEIERAAHLTDVPHSMLFVQGERDRLASLELLTPIVEQLGPRAELSVVSQADHGFHVPKRTGRTDPEVLRDIVGQASAWMLRHL